MEFSANATENEVVFIREVAGDSLRVAAEIVMATEDTLTVGVPEVLMGARENVLHPPKAKCDTVWVDITVAKPNQAPATHSYDFKFYHPNLLIYDQVTIGGPPIFPNK